MNKTDCIIWTGAKSGGYGVDRGMLAHRRAWESAYGAVPVGMVVHHTCAIKLCVNPEHLLLLTHGEHKAMHCATSKRGKSVTTNRDRRVIMPTDDEIAEAMAQSRGIKARAALVLGVSRVYLYQRLAECKQTIQKNSPSNTSVK